jgi:hypothetical protein
MAKAPKSAKALKPQDIELVDDAWPLFERLVKAAAKMGHRPHSEEKRGPVKPSPRKSKATSDT